MFHPYEIAICGYSDSGKTTLSARLIAHWAGSYRVGYVKHSGHDFDIDREGKDTAKARDAGASRVLITNDAKTAMTTAEPLDFVQQRAAFDDCDFVLAEGWRHGAIPKIVIVGDGSEVLDDLRDDEAGPVVAAVGGTAPAGLPCFDRDDVEGIAAFVIAHFEARAIPLHGLVLAGGRSTRMKKDKASLEYAGTSQLEHVYGLVSDVCAETFVSARRDQWENDRFADLPQLHDRFIDVGPSGGILTALETDRDAAWLVVACDLPYLDAQTLHGVVEGRNSFKVATAYVSANDGMPEPLCAIYEPRARSRLLQFMAVGYTCPRKALLNSNVELLELSNRKALDNVNHPEEYEAAKAELTTTS